MFCDFYFLVVFSLLVLGAHAQEADAEAEVEGEERPRVLCGRILADTRMLYCFSNTEPQKRSTPSGLIATLYQRQQISRQSLWQWMGQSRALALRSKRDPGLVDECCLKACYISELLSYC